MMVQVLDASVAAKWFLPSLDEPLTGQAYELFRLFSVAELELIVPDIFWAEFGAILWKAVRRKRFSQADADAALSAMLAMNLPTTPTALLLRDAFTIAKAFDRTVYDSVYVALAVRTKAPLVTADERLANALGGAYPVRWLGLL